MATSHLKSGQIQQEHTRGGWRGVGHGGGGEKEEEIKWKETKRRPGWKQKASKVLLFPTGRLDETPTKSVCVCHGYMCTLSPKLV